jgi:hypothetical protein
LQSSVVALTPTQTGLPTSEQFYQSVFDLGWTQVLIFGTACVSAWLVLRIISSFAGR